MTARQSKFLRFIGYLPLLALLGGGAKWAYDKGSAVDEKESKSEHAIDMARIDSKLERLLDLACDGRRDKRACVPEQKP